MTTGSNGGLWHRPVRATAEQPNLKAVRRRRDGASTSRDVPGRSEHDVLAEHDNWLWKTCEEVVIDHGLGALRGLLARLEDHHQCAPPGIPRLSKQRGGAGE